MSHLLHQCAAAGSPPRGGAGSALWIRVSARLAAGFGEREPLVAEAGDDLQPPT